MFFYDRYWRQWDRRLVKTHFGVYDISLTPINNDWETVKECRIRRHATRQDSPLVERLPTEIIDSMIEHLGDELTSLLIHHNFVKEIGTSRLLDFSRRYIGGVPYRDMIP